MNVTKTFSIPCHVHNLHNDITNKARIGIIIIIMDMCMGIVVNNVDMAIQMNVIAQKVSYQQNKSHVHLSQCSSELHPIWVGSSSRRKQTKHLVYYE